MKCIILGCGGSMGVPKIGCKCEVCLSPMPENKRLRPSIYLQTSTTNLLVDSSPDLRTQALANNLERVDAVLYTHDHSDHICGIDELKVMNKTKMPLPAYMDKTTCDSLHIRFDYIFKQLSFLYPKQLEPIVIDPYQKFQVGDIEVQAFLQKHGDIHSLGYRFGKLAYSTDAHDFPEESFAILQGVDTWIVDCQQYQPLPSHGSVEKVLEWVEIVKPRLTILTHMSHVLEYNAIKKILPSNIVPAYDGMVLEF